MLELIGLIIILYLYVACVMGAAAGMKEDKIKEESLKRKKQRDLEYPGEVVKYD